MRTARSDPTMATVRYGQTEPAVWNNMPCLTVCVVGVVHRPSGPPDCVSIVSTTVSTVLSILSNLFGVFGLIAATGKGW